MSLIWLKIFIVLIAKIFHEYISRKILREVRYIRKTIGPNIRERRKIDGKFIKMTKVELINQIRYILKPSSDMNNDLNQLIKLSSRVHVRILLILASFMLLKNNKLLLVNSNLLKSFLTNIYFNIRTCTLELRT
jgi:hypothetical protein